MVEAVELVCRDGFELSGSLLEEQEIGSDALLSHIRQDFLEPRVWFEKRVSTFGLVRVYHSVCNET